MSMILWTPGVKLEEVEKQVILRAMAFYRGNKTQVASSLGIAIRTLDTRLEEYRIQDETERQRLEKAMKADQDRFTRLRGLAPAPDPEPVIKTESYVEPTAEELLAKLPKEEQPDDFVVDLSGFEEPDVQERPRSRQRR